MINVEQIMKDLGTQKVLKDLTTTSGKDKTLNNINQGRTLISKEALKLRQIMLDNKASRKPRWFPLIGLNEIASVLYLISSKISLNNDKIKWKRHHLILTIAKEFLDGDEKGALLFTEWIIENSIMFSRESKLVKGKSMVNYKLTEIVSEGIINHINEIACEEFYPLPTLKKPNDWTKDGVGGFETHQVPLVRKVEDLSFINDNHIRSINIMQNTPYKINKVAFEAIKESLVEPTKPTNEYNSENPIEYYRIKKKYESDIGK